MIRVAAEADVPRIVEMGRSFHAMSPWSKYPFDPAACAEYARGIMRAGVILVSPKGMIGGLIHAVPFSPSCRPGVELFWWGDADLKAAFEGWCRENGATAVQFSALADDRSEIMARLFRRSGFRPVETGYLKDL